MSDPNEDLRAVHKDPLLPGSDKLPRRDLRRVSASVAQLKKRAESAEAKAQKLQADKDKAVDAARGKYAERLQAAVDEAAAAQKEWLDAEAAEQLRDRPNGERVARSLGLEL